MTKLKPGFGDTSDAVAVAARTVRTEADGLLALERCIVTTDLGPAVARAVATIVQSRGRVVVTGMGKSGLVARKIAATFASTGTPSLFIHPAEASHGDLGMIAVSDVVLALSWSGETIELSDIINYCRRFAVPIIAVTSRADSTLAMHSDLCLTLPQVIEACPHHLAPTSSTTLQAALGDALAVSAIEARQFTPAEFHILHPRGRLGARLLTVGELMSSGTNIPQVAENATIVDAMLEMSVKRFGITAIVDAEEHLLGAFSDGDLRRALAVATVDAPVSKHMTAEPVQAAPDMLASEALALMNARKILQLFVCRDRRPVGIVHLHDILRARVA